MRKILLLLLVIGLVAVICTGAAGAAMTITASPAVPTTKDSVTFSVSDANLNATTFTWNFGDDGTGSGKSATYTFSKAGTFSVKVTASGTNMSQEETATKEITITSATVKPVASFTSNTSSGTAPLSVKFEDTSTGSPTSWQWDFGDGNTSTNQNPDHVYTVADTYTVKLTVTGEGGISDSTTTAITISGNGAVPVVTISSFLAVKVNEVVTFTASATNSPTSYTWNFGDDTSNETGVSPTHSFSRVGTYNVTCTATNSVGSSRTAVRTITVSEGESTTVPTATTSTDKNILLSVSPLTGTAPLTVNFDYTPVGFSESDVTKRYWYFDYNNDSEQWKGDKSTSHTYTVDGTFKVRLEITIAGKEYTNSTTVTVGNGLIAGFTASPLSGTPPLKVSFKDTSSGSPTSWEWDFSEGSSRRQTVQNPTYTFDDPGTFTVTLTIKDDDGKTNSTTKVITVNAESTATPTKTATRTATPTATAKALTSAAAETTSAEADLVPNPLDIVDEFLRLLLAMLNPANYALNI